MKFSSDIDIDLADRDRLLDIIPHTPASIRGGDGARRHNTGVYVTPVPWDPVHGTCALDYGVAESRGYVKLDLLNIWLYRHVRDEAHLQRLMQEPDWSKMYDRDTFEQLIHIGRHWEALIAMPEPVNSIPRLAMFLAVIRPAKRHLIGQPWSAVAHEVWISGGEGYQFKKSHSLAYAHLVVVNMNLLAELGHSLDQGD